MPSKKQSKEIEEKNLYLIPNFEIPNSFHNSLVFLVNRMSRKNWVLNWATKNLKVQQKYLNLFIQF
jgi:hypothetical protein